MHRTLFRSLGVVPSIIASLVATVACTGTAHADLNVGTPTNAVLINPPVGHSYDLYSGEVMDFDGTNQVTITRNGVISGTETVNISCKLGFDTTVLDSEPFAHTFVPYNTTTYGVSTSLHGEYIFNQMASQAYNKNVVEINGGTPTTYGFQGRTLNIYT